MTIVSQLTDHINAAVSGLSLSDVTFTLSHPADADHGDYATNVAMILFGMLTSEQRQQWPQPRLLAEAIAAQLKTNPALTAVVSEVTVAGPGFINFTLSEHFLLDSLRGVSTKHTQFEMDQNGDQPQQVTVEFTDPNPFKEFHIGHLYSNTVGEAISRLLEATGVKVRRADYFGDVGLHAAKSVWGMIRLLKEEGQSLEKLAAEPLAERVQLLGQSYARGSQAFESDAAAKSDITKLNKLLYVVAQDIMVEEKQWQPLINYRDHLDPDTLTQFDYDQVRQLFSTGKTWSLAYFDSIYNRVGMQFDAYYPESEVAEYGMQLVQEGLEKGVFQKSQGAIVFDASGQGLHTRVFINSSGLPTYEAKELGLAPTKYKHQPYDLSIIVTGNEIDEYFKVLIAALTALNPELGRKTRHISHGMVRLPEGKMSSRTGKIITGEWLLDEAKARILDVLQAAKKGFSSEQQTMLAEAIGQAAIKYAFLKNSIGKDIAFNFDDSLSFQGNSGPYLQYTLVRCLAVLKKAGVVGTLPVVLDGVSREQLLEQLNRYITKSFDTVLNNKDGLIEQLTAEELNILRYIYQYYEVVAEAAQNNAPHLLCQYAFELAQRFNQFYTQQPILDAPSETQQKFRLTLASTVAVMLAKTVQILNIKVVTEM